MKIDLRWWNAFGTGGGGEEVWQTREAAALKSNAALVVHRHTVRSPDRKRIPKYAHTRQPHRTAPGWARAAQFRMHEKNHKRNDAKSKKEFFHHNRTGPRLNSTKEARAARAFRHNPSDFFVGCTNWPQSHNITHANGRAHTSPIDLSFERRNYCTPNDLSEVWSHGSMANWWTA